MNTSCSSWSYHRTIAAKKMDQTAWVRECAALGLDGVGLLGGHFPGTDRAYLVALKKLCADLYLTIAMVSADGHLTVADDAQRQKEVEAIPPGVLQIHAKAEIHTMKPKIKVGIVGLGIF